MVPTVFLFNLSSEVLPALKKLCLTHRLRAVPVPPQQFSLPLKALGPQAPAPAEAPSASSEDSPAPFSDPMLLFSGVAPGQLDSFLRGFRKAKLAPISLKAVMTPTNAEWDAVRLHRELTLEQEAMAQGRRLHHTDP